MAWTEDAPPGYDRALPEQWRVPVRAADRVVQTRSDLELDHRGLDQDHPARLRHRSTT